MAAITLSGLLHCGFLDMDKDMLVCSKHGVFQLNTYIITWQVLIVPHQPLSRICMIIWYRLGSSVCTCIWTLFVSYTYSMWCKAIKNSSLGSQANIFKIVVWWWYIFLFFFHEGCSIFSLILTMCNSYKNLEKVMF